MGKQLIRLNQTQLKQIVVESIKRVLKEEKELLSLEQLEEKFPEIKFTFEKKGNGIYKGSYFVRADIKTQGGEMEYLGALKGSVSHDEGLKFLNNVAFNNYDKFY